MNIVPSSHSDPEGVNPGAGLAQPGLGPASGVSPLDIARSAGSRPGEEASPESRKLSPYIFQQPAVLSEGALFSRSHRIVQDYAARWIRNPDPGSTFDRVTKPIRWLPDKALFLLMRALRYDGLVFVKPGSPGEVIGHAFCQRHGTTLHMFSIGVHPIYQGQGVAKKMLHSLLEHARSRPDVNRVRLGAGGHPAVARIVEGFSENASPLGLVSEGNAFFSFLDKAH